ncbi:rRNA pseudouridine synthase [bacterium]|nr:rRNA pseudouridine synthase [bacterium]
MSDHQESHLRLNRFLAETGICSRRDADQLIFSGRVTVNGKIIESPAFRLDSKHDAVKVEGRRVWSQPLVYVLMNKPEGVVSTAEDPQQRTTVIDLLRGVRARIYPVGRLDYNTSGAILLTNDGELAQRLAHPRYEFPKTYHAKVSDVPSREDMEKMAAGVRIPDKFQRYTRTRPAKARLVKRMKKCAVVEIVLKEGRQHQVRKMCAAIHHPVTALTRVKFGFLSVTGLPVGRWRYLTSKEIEKLKKGAEINESRQSPSSHR